MRGWEINPSFHWILMILSHKQNSLIHFSQTWSAHSDSAVPQSTSVSVPWCIFHRKIFGERVLIKKCKSGKLQRAQEKTCPIWNTRLTISPQQSYPILWIMENSTFWIPHSIWRTLWVYGKPLIFSLMPSPPVLSYPKEQTQMITDFCSENADKFKGLPLETCLEVLDEWADPEFRLH